MLTPKQTAITSTAAQATIFLFPRPAPRRDPGEINADLSHLSISFFWITSFFEMVDDKVFLFCSWDGCIFFIVICLFVFELVMCAFF